MAVFTLVSEHQAEAFIAPLALGKLTSLRGIPGGIENTNCYLPAVLRAAALRFWLSRLRDLHFPRDSALLNAHDPEHFFRVLCHHRRSPSF